MFYFRLHNVQLPVLLYDFLGYFVLRFIFFLEEPGGVNTTKDSQIESASADVMDTS